MPTYTATVRVTTNENWEVEAETENEAWDKFHVLHDDVIMDYVGETVDWVVTSVKES